MTEITNGAITFDANELAWFAENYGGTAWCAYFEGMDEITTHDRQYPGDGDGDDGNPEGEPFTEETIRAYLAEFDSRFGPGSPLAVELQSPSYAIALHYGKPAFGSHEHGYAINPPGGSTARPGDCACGHTWAEAEKVLDAEMAEIEWSVYVAGPNVNLVAQGQGVLNFVPTGPPHTEATAKEHAAAINEFMARVDAENPSPFNPVIRAVVLHHGQPVDETAGTP
jgi:hypothetical protein